MEQFMQLTGRPPSSSDAPASSRRARRSTVAYASVGLLVIAVIGAVALFERRAGGVGRADAPIDAACEPWDSVASDAIARLVADSSDTAARQLGDAVFRLRRARKNCRLGWVSLACRDYRAVMAGTAGAALANECFSAVMAGAR